MKILFPTNLSNYTWLLNPYLVEITGKSSSKIIILHVNNDLKETSHIEKELLRLKSLFESLTNSSNIEIEVMLTTGDISAEIVQLATDTNTDFIIMGVKKAQFLHEMITHQNTIKVLNECDCTVFLIPESTTYKDINNIAFAIDYSNYDLLAINKVIQFTELCDAKLMMLNITDESFVITSEDRAKYVETIRNQTNYSNLDFHFYTNPNISEGIEEFTSRYKIDVLAVTHQKGKIQGSISHLLTMNVKLPLLIFQM